MRRIAFYVVALAVAVGAVVVGVDLLHESDEERVEKVLDQLRSAATSGDAGRILPLVDLDGDGFEITVGHDKERFSAGELDALEERLTDGVDWLGDSSLRFDSSTVTISGDRAHAYFRVVLQRAEGGDEAFPVDLTLRRTGDSWLAVRFRALTSGGERSARR